MGNTFVIYYGDGFPFKSLTFSAEGKCGLSWITALNYLIKTKDRVPYSIILSRWLWKNFYQVSEKHKVSKIRKYLSRVQLCGLRAEKHNHHDISFQSLFGKMTNEHHKEQLDMASDEFHKSKGTSSNQPLLHMQSITNILLGVDPTITVDDRKDKNPRHLMFYCPNRLRSWLLKEGIKLSLQDIQHFTKTFNADKTDYAAVQRLYDGICLMPNLLSDICTKEIQTCYEAFSEEKFIRFYVNQEKRAHFEKSEGLIERLRIEAKALYAQLVTWNRALCAHTCIADTENKLTKVEFINYMFSDYNSIWNPEYDRVYQDMSQPMSNYWIYSSHNTYLIGDQLYNDSSVDAYMRTLLMGSRCVELDIWNGDTEPVITHGNTLTSKIKLADVLKTIKEYAFVASDYPVILSLENHCDIAQQRIMAELFLNIFKDMLLVAPAECEENCLPSPENLKNKIILKAKKIRNVPEEDDEVDEKEFTESCLLSGQMYLRDPVKEVWRKQYCVLMKDKKLRFKSNENQEIEDKSSPVLTPKGMMKHMDVASANAGESKQQPDLGFDKLLSYKHAHTGVGSDVVMEEWFHGILSRQEANDWLYRYSFLGDCTFLVRLSEKHQNALAISMFHKDTILHVYLNFYQNITEGTSYYAVDKESMRFTTMRDFIEYAKVNPLPKVKHAFHNDVLKLGTAAPQRYQICSWYMPNISKTEAENLLRKANVKGSYLVRPSSTHNKIDFDEPDRFVVSYIKSPGKIVHTTILNDGQKYHVFNQTFTSLFEAIQSFERHGRLLYPTNPDTVEFINQRFSKLNEYTEDGDYMEITASPVKSNVDLNMDGDNSPLQILTNTLLEATSEDDSFTTMDLDKGFTVSVKPRDHQGGKYILFVKANNAQFNFGHDTEEEMNQWMNQLNKLKEPSKKVDLAKVEKESKIAKQMSDLIIYCQAVGFKWEHIDGSPNIMSSFSETKFENLAGLPYKNDGTLEKSRKMAEYLKRHFGRIYPKGIRFNSSNYDPVGPWSVGAQIVALNLQTFDRYHQLNQGRFLDNGGCGYVLRSGGPNDLEPRKSEYNKGGPRLYEIELVGARHMPNVPYGCVEFELITEPWDKMGKQVHRIATRGQLCVVPVKSYSFKLRVRNPSSALLRIAYLSTNEQLNTGPATGAASDAGSVALMSHATLPVHGIRAGLRSVPMNSADGSRKELSTLLVHVRKRKDLKAFSNPVAAAHSVESLNSSTSSASTLSREMEVDMNLMSQVMRWVDMDDDTLSLAQA